MAFFVSEMWRTSCPCTPAHAHDLRRVRLMDHQAGVEEEGVKEVDEHLGLGLHQILDVDLLDFGCFGGGEEACCDEGVGGAIVLSLGFAMAGPRQPWRPRYRVTLDHSRPGKVAIYPHGKDER